MKAILISIKPKWVAKILNGDKIVEVRTSKALASAIQKLINENGYADIYAYCTKDKETIAIDPYGGYTIIPNKHKNEYFNGKVVFKFRCYNVEEIKTCERHSPELLKQSRLNAEEFYTYLTKGKNFLGKVLGYAIHISDLEIFDEPKELDEFKKPTKYCNKDCSNCDFAGFNNKTQKWEFECSITKAPQNFCYVEVE